MTFQSSDVPAALKFYSDVHNWSEHIYLNDQSGNMTAAFVRINDRQWLELRPETESGTDRLLQFGLEVADAEATRLYLAASGWAVPPTTSSTSLGNRSFKVLDPDGHTVEFVEYLRQGWPARSARVHSDFGGFSLCLMHIGFDVQSLDKAMEFYRDILGCREFWRGSQDDRTLSWVHLKLPDDENYVEFMLYDKPLSIKELGIYNHFGVEVSNMFETIEAVSGRIASRPYPRDVSYNIGKCRHRLANFYDPDGTRSEFMERGTFDGVPTPSSTVPAPKAKRLNSTF